jgi:periplasmic protein TonB
MKTKVESFEDIIFENRNKEYGAYELRQKYSKRGTIAMIIALVIVSFAVGGPLIAGIIEQGKYNRYLEKNTTMNIENIKVDREDIAPPPPPPPPVAVEQVRFTAPKIVNELTEPDQELASFDDLAKGANTGSIDTTTKVIIQIEEPTEKIVDEEAVEIIHVQEKPVFPGGDAALLKYIAENTKYPALAQEQGIEGKVYIRFVVTKTGEIGNATVMRQMDPSLDEEALRVVKTLPKWTPGKNNGNPVNVWFIIPVRFQLKQ